MLVMGPELVAYTWARSFSYGVASGPTVAVGWEWAAVQAGYFEAACAQHGRFGHPIIQNRVVQVVEHQVHLARADARFGPGILANFLHDGPVKLTGKPRFAFCFQAQCGSKIYER